MKTFIHPFAVKVTEEEVVLNKAFPLVRELAHKYGLSVIAVSKRLEGNLNPMYMARTDGIPVCKVFFMEDKESFAIRNCMKQKDRGRSRDDKLTYFGKKVSFVMKTIEKEGLIPKDTQTFITALLSGRIKGAVDNLSSSYGEIRKGSSISGEIIHSLMEIALGNRHVSTLSAESMTKVQSVLDKYRDADKTRVERQQELSEIFSKPVWAIFYDETDSFCVGRMKLSPMWDDASNASSTSFDLSIVEDFRRVADVTEVAELIPTMAMLKTSIEQARPDVKYEFVGDSGFFPNNWNGVSTSLGVMTVDCGDRWSGSLLLKPRMIMVSA
jgi:uncharacterized protein YkuJ